jgi:hypothetical protein
MTTITIKQPEPGEELVRLLNSGRSDELNVDGKSYRPDARGAFHVPRRHVPAGREKEALNAALVSLCEDAPDA